MKRLAVLLCRVFLATGALSSAWAQTPPPAAPPPAAPAAPPPWNVNAPGFPATEVPLDVTEGTWMSVDVSPKGDELVFDLLGDLYTLPMTGGEAKPLTTGAAWDMQPRYSPDGASIAFTSDRGGGDNLWVMKRDGSDARPVTQESFRLLNSPTWSPDSQYLVGRKHFSSRRSLGAGEMWLYHRSGGEGIQLTERPNDQKDAGEPAFSPDGRYLYFSQDTTPGRVFEYNKDPNSQIYVIQRLNLDTKELEPFITGPGGSVRPTPSPDGKSLAFVRRVRNKSVLYTADLVSGAERPLFDGLDRDMQETWAIHGVYPAMAWTPDSKSLVFWAQGKLHRIEVASKRVTPIPFHVKGTRTLFARVHSPQAQAVAPERFPVKMLRWVQVSPQGNRVVYQALGHLYIRELPNGQPRRLTKQTEHFELHPSFSRDGKSIVYTTWDDDALGTVRVVSASGGEGKVVSAQPGFYLEPAFSPDGRSIVYRATSGGYLLPGLYSRDTGLYVVGKDGGTPRKLSKDGEQPHFGAASDRVYFLAVEGGDKEDKRELRSIGLDGTAPRTHLTSSEVVSYRVSPDERWVAFQEVFNAYVAPLSRGGKTVVASKDSKALPVTRVSRDAGNSLHWSGDSKRLHWSLGPELYSRELKEAFAFVQGAPEKLPEPPQKGVDISFLEKADAPTGTVALVGGRIVSMRGDEVIEDGVVVVSGNRITAVGKSGQVQVPAGAKVVDVKGKTVMPGLVDVHWHGPMGSEGILPEQSWVQLASLAFGVTTLHDPSNNSAEIFAASELGRSGRTRSPRIFSTGTILYGAQGPGYRAPIDTLDDARSHLRRMKALGAFSVKSYNQPRRDQRQKVLQAARELGMLVVPEGGSLFQHNMTMVVDGHTGVEHSLPVGRIYADVLQLWGPSQVGYTPTLGVAYGGLMGEEYWYQKTNVWENPRLMAFVPRRVVDAASRRRLRVPDEEFNHVRVATVAKALNDAGVSVQLGAHGQREGLAAHWELSMFGQGGMSPLQALRAGTLAGAAYLGLDKELGSLEVGKLADLIVLDRNPLENLSHTDSVRYTMVNGRLFDAATMNEVGNHPRPRAKLFFEQEGGEAWAPGVTHTLEED